MLILSFSKKVTAIFASFLKSSGSRRGERVYFTGTSVSQLPGPSAASDPSLHCRRIAFYHRNEKVSSEEVGVGWA